ncbi:MAG: deoxyribonuclease IV [Candidatus Acetothermia bacterium]|jgi:deoxyribonuclease-4|nr:deoxyribonuclease IV [Candidatus Acetothermia bacterium]MDH7505228.1 deoxyribonuclease IV [Candidatus Acetothermia bacterium]
MAWEEMLLGCHLSIAGGLERVFAQAEELGINALQIFSHNARSWKMGELPPEEAARFRLSWAASRVEYIVIHTIYLINLASPREELYRRSIGAVVKELERAAALGVPQVNTHIGAHVGMGQEWGLARARAALREVLRRTDGLPVKLLLENTAGEGTVLGSRFEELALLLELDRGGERLGLCFDTCHGFAAGYDIASARGLEETLAQLELEIGLERLALIHLNDSQYKLGSHKDRHQHIGEGEIGLEGFARIINHPKLRDLPFILETPKLAQESAKLDSDADPINLDRIRRLREPRAW